MVNQLDVIVHGICTTDILFSGLPYLPPAGEEVYSKWLGYTVGGSYITAAALARLGVKVGVICPLGTDQFSDFIRSTMQTDGVTSLAYETETNQANVSVCMSDATDRAIVSYSDPLSQADFLHHSLQVLERTWAPIFHVSAAPNTASLIEKAAYNGMFVSMDLGWDEAWLRSQELLELLSKGNLFMPNDREACAIANTDSPEAAIRLLKEHVQNVVVKYGAKGSLCWSEADAGPTWIDAYPALEVIDTTGAGDNFDAGTLYGILQKMDLCQAARIGNLCGSVSVGGLGGTGNMASLTDVQRVLDGTPAGQLLED